MTEYRFVSADQHLDLLWCPPDLWQRRVPERHRSAAPRVVDTDSGKRWTWEGKLSQSSAQGRTGVGDFTGSALEAVGALGAVVETLDGERLPPSDPELMLEHMDLAKIWAAVIYGPPRKMEFDDPELNLVCNDAWNDFMLEMSSHDPGRIIGLPNLPTWDVDATVLTAKRVVEAGARGVEFSVFTAAEPVWSPLWEPLWATLEEARVPVGFHIGRKAGDLFPPKEHGRYPAYFCDGPFATHQAMAEIIFSGTLDRHPDLKVVFAECRTGWLAFFIDHMDIQQRERGGDVTLELKPSEYWRRQMAATFEDDVIGGRLLAHEWSHLQYGVMWGSDYPHKPISWPKTDELADWLFEGVPEDVRKSATYGRACEFYGLEMPTAST
jgi:predicted TIM-barrel fold metal-dependent hydrolase